MEKKNIVLIGMPGSGKSSIGVLLAKSAGLGFIDTDLVIQEKTGEKLQEIIDHNGIEAFLKTEDEVLSTLKTQNTVIATGGSAVFSKNGMDNLSKNGVIVFLDVSLDEIKRRINNITTRGIAMKSGEGLDSVYKERLPLYNSYADFTVTSDSIEDTISEILRLMN